MSTNTTEIDIAAIEAELAGMSEEELAAEVLKVRTKQKIQQKKMQGSASHKAYQMKAQAKRKAIIALAKSKGIFDAINAQAEKDAEAKLLEAAGNEVQDTEVE